MEKSVRYFSYQSIYQWLKAGIFVFEESINFEHKSDYNLYILITKSVVRNIFKFEFIIKQLCKNKKIDIEVKSCLLIGLAQLHSDTGISEYAAVDETVKIIKLTQKKFLSGFINGVLRNYLRKKEELDKKIDSLPFTIKYSIPEWMFKRWRKHIPLDFLKDIIQSFSMTPKFHIKVRDDVDPEELESFKKIIDVDSNQIISNSFLVNKIEGLFETELFLSGKIIVQDLSSQILCDLIHSIPKKNILDACSAPGGKLFHIEWGSQNVERIVGADLSLFRLNKLKENFKRLNSKAFLINMDAESTSLKRESFDFILADVPCSATGIIKKHPEIKLQRKEEDFLQNQKQQVKLLKSLSNAIEPSGYLLYSTCSLEREENELAIESFLQTTEEGKNFKQVPIQDYSRKEILEKHFSENGDLMIFPSKNTTGLFACLLKKNSYD